MERALLVPGAANTVLSAFGPENLTAREAFTRYVSLVRPDVRVATFPVWALRRLGGFNPAIAGAVKSVELVNRVLEPGDPAQANALLGPNLITLRAWCGAPARTGEAA